MLDKILQALSFDLSKEQVNGVMRVGWRVVIIVHILFACGWLTAFGLVGFARADEISGIKGQVAQLQAQFQKDQAQEAVNALEIQVKVLDQEIFAIQAKLAEQTRLGQQADALYASRLVTLQSDKAATERRLKLAMRNPALQLPGPG